MYVWSGSAWVSVAAEVESLATYATQSYAAAQPGMKMVVPTSVAVGSGTGAVDTNGAVTFTSASSISLNGVFSSTYDNYKIIVDITSKTTTASILMRMRTGGADNSSTNYNGSVIEKGTNSTTINGYNDSNQNRASICSIRTGGRATVEIYSPQKTEYTSIISSYLSWTGTVNVANDQGFTTSSLSVTTSYDSATFFTDAGTVTGTIRVYGYKN
jgi:hypothetical protein